MASVLVHTADESITLTAQAARRLLERGDGDAALLYLALLRHHGASQPRSLAGELRWDRPRIEGAERTLRELGLIAPAAESLPPEPADERPAYQRTDIAQRLEESGEFRIDLTPAWLTEALYGLLASGAWAVAEGRVARNDFTHMIVELLLGGALRREEP